MTWAESETLEFKASFSEWKETAQTLCAFANAKGGMVAASLFRQVGVIESFGTGFQRMAQACVEAGNPAPQYLEAAGAFVVRFPFHAQIQGTPPVTTQVATQVEALQGKREGVNAGVNAGVLLALIRENPDLRLPQLAARLGTASKTAERWLASLRHRGAIEFHGSPKTGGYRVTSASSVAVGS